MFWASHLQAAPVPPTPPLGFKNITIKGASGSPRQTTFVSLGLSPPALGQYAISNSETSSENRTVLTLPNATFAPGQLSQTSAPHYAQVVAGPNVGLISEVVGNGIDQVVLADNIQDVVVPGQTRIKIYPYWTLSSAFPAGGGLGAGLSSASADNLTLLPPSGETQVYFFHSASKQWRRGLSNASDIKIPAGTGIMVTRKRPGDVTLTVSGEVVLTPVEVVIGSATTSPKSTMIGNPFPVAIPPLRLSGLVTGDAQTGLAGGLSSASADNLVIYDRHTGLPKMHYYHTPSGKWRSGLEDASETRIPDGGAVIVTRKSSRPSFSWYVPAPPMNLD